MLHYTAMHSAAAALERLCDPDTEVSAHYLIGRDGTLWQMVDEDQRAWHAGAGEWCGLEDINSRSIGIEMDNGGDHPFAEPQMAGLETLLADLMTRHQIAQEAVIGHSDMAPGRKFDPGARFDWSRLARRGLASRAGGGAVPQAASMDHFRQLARAAGYSAEVEDEVLLSAVRLRFRPWGKGPLVPEDFTALPRPTAGA